MIPTHVTKMSWYTGNTSREFIFAVGYVPSQENFAMKFKMEGMNEIKFLMSSGM